jgi:hypothetical protein
VAEPFDVNLEDPQGVSLTPLGSPPPDVGILPDTGPLVGPPPQLRLPPPPPPPPRPTDDPRQQLAALIALGMSVGMGPRAGGAGALQGFAQTQQALRQDQLATYQRALNEQKVQEGVLKTQFTQDESNYRQREAKLQQALANFKTQAMKVPDKAAYDGLAEAYGNSLRAAGYRTIDPNWLRQNIPYVKPSQSSLAEKAFKAWTANPNNKRLLDENPAQAATSVVEVDLNGDGVKERMPLAKLAEAAGQSFAHDADGGLIAVPKEANTGTSPFDVTLKGLVDEFKATNRRDPNPREKNNLIAQAVELAKAKPETPPTNSFQLQPEIDPKTGQQTGRFFSFNTKTNQWSQPSGSGPEATKAGPQNATLANRLSSATAVIQTGNDMIKALKGDLGARLGPVLSRYATFEDFIGNPPPEFSKLVGQIESYALANIGVHGMRSNNGAEAIKQTLGVGRHTPESIIATIEGLNGFAQHLIENEGKGAATPAGAVSDDALKSAAEILRKRNGR